MFVFKEIEYLTDGQLDLILDSKVPGHLERFSVPAYYFSIKKHGELNEIGKIEIRIGHHENTFYGGNIGYEIHPPYRGHRYAEKACHIVRRVAELHGVNHLYISCLPNNIPSNKTCQRLGAKCLGTYLIPFHNEMFLMGVREINVYEWTLNTTNERIKKKRFN